MFDFQSEGSVKNLVILIVIYVGAVWLLIRFILCGLALTLSRKRFMDREKLSPFECGFDPQGASRLPFSLRFYLIALIFLIFDVEIVLILPLVVLITRVDLKVWGIILIGFIFVLLLGLYYEWAQGALN
jgi:NADH-ubiquinone oxidoreductase chain 3